MYTHAARDPGRQWGGRFEELSEQDLNNLMVLYRNYVGDPNASSPWAGLILQLLRDTGLFSSVFDTRKESLRKFSHLPKDEYDTKMEAEVRPDYELRAQKALLDPDFSFRVAKAADTPAMGDTARRSIPGRIRRMLATTLSNSLMLAVTAQADDLRLDKLWASKWGTGEVSMSTPLGEESGATLEDTIEDPHGDPAVIHGDVEADVVHKHPEVAPFIPEIVSMVLTEYPAGEALDASKIFTAANNAVSNYARTRQELSGGQREDAFADIPYWEEHGGEIAKDIANAIMQATKSYQASEA